MKKALELAKYAVLVLALIGIGVGVVSQEPKIVEKKATRVCLECIGIG